MNIYASCSPLTIRYGRLKDPKYNRDSVFLDNGNLLVYYDIQLNHYPGKKVTSIIDITLINNSRDTFLFYGNPSLQFKSKKNVVDTSQANTFLATFSHSQMLPGSEMKVSTYYWSNTFNGSYKTLKNTLKDDEIEINIKYEKKQENIVTDKIIIKPQIK